MMPEQKQLPEAIHQRISADAEIQYPITGENGGDAEYSFDQIQDRKQMAYVNGATVEATRSLVLVEALEAIEVVATTDIDRAGMVAYLKTFCYTVVEKYNQVP